MRSKDQIDEDVLICSTRMKKLQSKLTSRSYPLRDQANMCRELADQFTRMGELLDELDEVDRATRSG